MSAATPNDLGGVLTEQFGLAADANDGHMIETRDLTKKYGELFAIKSINLNLSRGDVFGFIGPNGSGKTTTMRILATLLNPTWGEAYVGGYSIYTRPKEIRRMIGYMPDFFGVYDDMKVIEYLEFFAAAYRIRGPKRRQVCDEVLELVELGYKREALVTSLSRGMTQRLGLARVLLHDPQVLLLDEPASGLDPRARIEIRMLLKRLGTMGKTIMVSSHILPELADICNKVGIIERGELKVNAEVADVMRQVRRQTVLNIGVAGNSEVAAKVLEGHEMVDRVETGEKYLTVTLVNGQEDYSELATLLIAAGHKLTLLREEELNLETAFMALTKGITA
jgi:ABC-2 type transport system ATP-binding protein